MSTPDTTGLREAVEAWCDRWSDDRLARLTLDQRVPLRRARDEFQTLLAAHPDPTPEPDAAHDAKVARANAERIAQRSPARRRPVADETVRHPDAGGLTEETVKLLSEQSAYNFRLFEQERAARDSWIKIAQQQQDARLALVAVLDRYFDFGVDSWDEGACPEPEDVWRLHRDLRALLPADDTEAGS